MFKKINRENKKGFTLAELLIVVAIIGVLVAISIPIFTAQLEKAREAGYLDAHYQPKLSNTKSAMLADEIATRLKIRNRWKVFEQFWNRHDMYKDNYEGRNQKQSLSFLDEIRTVLD